jgi:hypothetical protein
MVFPAFGPAAHKATYGGSNGNTLRAMDIDLPLISPP